jgi:hypothetical protein
VHHPAARVAGAPYQGCPAQTARHAHLCLLSPGNIWLLPPLPLPLLLPLPLWPLPSLPPLPLLLPLLPLLLHLSPALQVVMTHLAVCCQLLLLLLLLLQRAHWCQLLALVPQLAAHCRPARLLWGHVWGPLLLVLLGLCCQPCALLSAAAAAAAVHLPPPQQSCQGKGQS